MRLRSTIQSAAVGCVALASVAAGQPQQGWVPVDQAVADLDPLATSLRDLSPGLRLDGEHTSLFEWRQPPTIDPADTSNTTPHEPSLTPPLQPQPVYYRVGPGFRARLNRLDYQIRGDGRFAETIPNNTVFELNPLVRSPLSVSPNLGWNDTRVDHRLDTRLDTRLNARVDTPTNATLQQRLPITQPMVSLPIPNRSAEQPHLSKGQPSAPHRVCQHR